MAATDRAGLTTAQGRRFGLTLAAGFAVVGALLWWRAHPRAAMVAWAGAERLASGLIDDLASAARARWPLDPQAEKALGAGVKA